MSKDMNNRAQQRYEASMASGARGRLRAAARAVVEEMIASAMIASGMPGETGAEARAQRDTLAEYRDALAAIPDPSARDKVLRRAAADFDDERIKRGALRVLRGLAAAAIRSLGTAA